MLRVADYISRNLNKPAQSYENLAQLEYLQGGRQKYPLKDKVEALIRKREQEESKNNTQQRSTWQSSSYINQANTAPSTFNAFQKQTIPTNNSNFTFNNPSTGFRPQTFQ